MPSPRRTPIILATLVGTLLTARDVPGQEDACFHARTLPLEEILPNVEGVEGEAWRANWAPSVREALDLCQRGTSVALEVSAENMVALGRAQLANAAIEGRRPAEALATFQEAVRTAPNYAEAWAGLGLALQLTDRFPEAVEAFDQLQRLEPEYLDFHPLHERSMEAAREGRGSFFE